MVSFLCCQFVVEFSVGIKAFCIVLSQISLFSLLNLYMQVHNVIFFLVYIDRANAGSKIICEDSSDTVSCPSGQYGMSITYANYGRTNGGPCGGPVKTTSCRKNVLSAVRRECNGKSSCHLSASNAIFHDDPCEDTNKYLEVHYLCKGTFVLVIVFFIIVMYYTSNSSILYIKKTHGIISHVQCGTYRFCNILTTDKYIFVAPA